MKRETGNKTVASANKVSIQQSLDGHSFSAEGLERITPDDAGVEVEVLSAQTLLVPEELFAAPHAAALLAAAGMACTSDQSAVWSEPCSVNPASCSEDPAERHDDSPDADDRARTPERAVAVMALNSEALQQVESQLGPRARFTTPLLTVPASADSVVWLCRKAGTLYVKVYDLTLRFAEAIPAPGEADLLYFIERLAGVFPLGEYELRIAGDDAKALRRLLAGRFRDAVCE